jgi:hypothetical protein
MIENIIQTPQGYRATIDGTEWSIPDAPGNRFWQMVQDAIADGAEVTIEEPPPAPVPASISFAQLLIGLVTEQWITEAEGEAWLSGTLPGAVLLVIESLPTEQRFAAKARALRPSEVLRGDPLVEAMGTAAGKTEAEIDTFFQTYAGV